MRNSNPNQSTDEVLCFFCDYWWVLLLVLGLLGAGYFSRDLWLPALGVTPLPPATATLFVPTPAPLPTSTQVLGTGDVQVTLTWASTNDLDLWVTGPDSEMIFFNHPDSASGGKLDVDANRACQGVLTNSPVENVFWPLGEAPRGTYTVQVQYYQQCESEAVVPYHVRIKTDDQITEYDGVMNAADEMQTVTTISR